MAKRRKRNSKANSKAGRGVPPAASRHSNPWLVAQRQKIDMAITDRLLQAVLSRGVADHLNSKHALREYFLDLASSTKWHVLFFPLLRGLAEGAPHINEILVSFGPDQESFPLLIMVCQWKYLAALGDWRGQDELVEMVLKAGANVNYCLKNHCNALFFAVKYGSSRTVQLLLEANIDVQQRDIFGRTCLYNALEYPSPPIIRQLLEHLPADETFEAHRRDGHQAPSWTLADRVLQLLVTVEPIISWEKLGPPPARDVSEVLMLLHQKGSHFSSSCFALTFLGYLFASDVKMKTSKMKGIPMFKEVTKSLVGTKIPEAFIPVTNQDDQQNNDLVKSLEGLNIGEKDDNAETICSICQNQAKKRVTLYCDHTFCRQCIIDYGKTEHGDNCPVCHKQLCLELHESGADAKMTVESVLGLNNSFSNRGPQLMTNEQVGLECEYQGIYSYFSTYRGLRSKLVKQFNAGQRRACTRSPFMFTADQSSGSFNSEVEMTVDLAAGVTIISSQFCALNPKAGPVAIAVNIRNVPLLARISNRSIYTVVSKTLVENLGLKRIDSLTSKKFICTLTGKKQRESTFTCLEPFCLKIGDVEVTLRTAIEASPDPINSMFGIQLGLDFLYSGIWCPIDVKVGEGNQYMRVDGDKAWPVWNCSGEMLRYYSREGKVVNVPILHFSPFNRGIVPGLSLKADVIFEQCYWCCRTFPKGMKVCTTCYKSGKVVTYCGEKCQSLAYKIHKKTKHNDEE